MLTTRREVCVRRQISLMPLHIEHMLLEVWFLCLLIPRTLKGNMKKTNNFTPIERLSHPINTRASVNVNINERSCTHKYGRKGGSYAVQHIQLGWLANADEINCLFKYFCEVAAGTHSISNKRLQWNNWREINTKTQIGMLSNCNYLTQDAPSCFFSE